mmetsp:Transcript_41635/g.47952  ORF Transcript_41635/g.47952 Transcript_41635/m.47952 type:complete len:363 (+) Transcript_41635:30-1118(+)
MEDSNFNFTKDPELINLHEFEKRSSKILSKWANAYFSTGSCDETCLDENITAFQKIKLYPRIMKNISHPDLSTSIFGHQFSLPFGFAPSAFQKLAHEDGELATARIASDSNTLMILSQGSTYSLEDVHQEGGDGIRWFQCEFLKDRDLMAEQIQRAKDNGYTALVITCDISICGKRERIMRINSKEKHFPPAPNFQSLIEKYGEDGIDDQFEPVLNWSMIKWLKGITNLKVILKGVCHPEDAQAALSAGVDGIIVSNHGGRQLDSAAASIDLLAGVVDAVGGRIPVMMDGGVRRGGDVLKALAVGADFVFIGRPVIWGLACGGQKGVQGVVDILRKELEIDMTLTGVGTVGNISRQIIFSMN